MIDAITGKIKIIDAKTIATKVCGVSFKVMANSNNFMETQDETVFIYFHWSAENGPQLFGFRSETERDAFKLITQCPKIGPGTAQNILIQTSFEDLFGLISNEDEARLSKINGIGPKTAKNLIAFLKDKIVEFGFKHQGSIGETKNSLLDVKEALVSLGYSHQEINSCIKKIKTDGSFDEILREALKNIKK